MSDLRELRKKRSNQKGRFTVFANYLSSIQATKLSTCQVIELEQRISKLELLFDEFDSNQTEIEMLVDDSNAEISERSTIENIYYSLVSQAKALLTVDSKKEEEELKSNSSNNCNRQLVRLPTIQLPKFTGSYDNWLEFHDTFTSLIHNNDEIDNINKFHYLRSSLEGSAAVVVQSVEFSANNYHIAWDLLCERFNNKRQLIQNHVSALFKLETISKESSHSLKQLIDLVNKNLRALSTLDEPVDNWDTLLIYILSHKLDSKSFREWEQHKVHLDKNNRILFTVFTEFVRERADYLETLELSRHSVSQVHNPENIFRKNNSKMKALVSVGNNKSLTTSTRITCPKCNGDHYLNTCPQFLALNASERMQSLPRYRVCYNCFRSGHLSNKCMKSGCKVCKRKHHTLLHVSPEDRSQHPISNTLNSSDYDSEKANTNLPSSSDHVVLSSNVVAHSHSGERSDVLLSTALIAVKNSHGCDVIVRALLDSGSSSCLMTENIFHRLNLPYSQINKSIQGIGNSLSRVSKMCKVNMKSLNDDYSTDFYCFILPTITDNLPVQKIDLSKLNIPAYLRLADPKFNVPAGIDMILGADVFWSLLGSEKLSLGSGEPTLIQTKLGWLVCGPVCSGYVSTPTVPIKCNFSFSNNNHNSDPSPCCEIDDIQNQLTRFWQLEEVCSLSPPYSSEEKSCEEHFLKNTTRLPSGRFVVKIPLKESSNKLGDSLHIAKRCFFSVENRNKNRPTFDRMYKDFMAEYVTLGHMTKCSISNDKCNFIPHHGLLRQTSLTTKLRVVFNASAPTSSGVSFNAIQMVGPIVQDDLLSILIRFRQHRYIICSDVEKMYRQVVCHPSDRHLQQIVWRDDSSSPLQAYQLNTVTYGTASAPFLATRCLKQIGLECFDPKVKEVILHDFFVDDLLTGEDQLHDAIELRRKVTDALASACMPLRKWKSNEPALLSNETHSSFNLNMGGLDQTRTLGLCWETQTDELYFPIHIPDKLGNTKRDLLSVIARIFDPLGLLSPCVISLKVLLQRLWLAKVSWDEQLPRDVSKPWIDLIRQLPSINQMMIPRHVICVSPEIINLHCFCDSSELAYGAAIYVQSTNTTNDVTVRLLIAKSRVAPIKPVTLPRLELCAALVGARLYAKVISSLRCQVSTVTFWTDSMIVLGWLKLLPIKLNTFVRNRVAEILETTNLCTWRHVPTNDNPADFLSRGVSASNMHSLDLWWQGPSFLRQDSDTWPCTPGTTVNLPEIKRDVCFHTNVNISNNSLIDFERFSNLNRLQRSIVFVFRFIKLCRKESIISKYVSREELQDAMNFIIRQSQKESFNEYILLLERKPLPVKSSLLKFNVFLDESKIMRVGGRLQNSNFSYDKKHPILLQSTHRFTKLLFNYEHIRMMHAGPQLLLASLRETYWPIGGRNLAKACYRRCVRCRRLSGQTVLPQMGNFPTDRVSPSVYPFQNVGVDYAGPLTAVSRQGRGCRQIKVYVVLFVCFSVKAIHLELVSDLTSDNYLQALRRFMSRRGKPINIYSDNGTSFVGAYNEIGKFIKSNCSSISEGVAQEGINFHFIPPYAPHFGGLWEAGVKSTKYHLNRVLGNCLLTYEELNTTLVQIEAILNSRPLTALSSDPEDMNPLTPGHFIIGRPLTSLPTKDLTDRATSWLTRHQRIEQLRQHFWSRWSKEYISELQQRTKWRSCKNSIKLGSLVLIKEENLPPLKWKLGRIISLHPGTDNISRVADIKTTTGIIRRAFTKICPLVDSSVAC